MSKRPYKALSEPTPQPQTTPEPGAEALEALAPETASPVEPPAVTQPASTEVTAAVTETARQRKERLEFEDDQRRIKEFTAKIEAARRQDEPAPPVPQPVAPQILDQTKREMEAGRAQVAKNLEEQRNRAPVKKTASDLAHETRTVPVFRPSDHVPDPKVSAALKSTSMEV